MKYFIEFGSCACLHPAGYHGDCRDDDNRFLADELDAIYGRDGWIEVSADDAAVVSAQVDKVLHGCAL